MGIFSAIFNLVNNIFVMGTWVLLASIGKSMINYGISMAALSAFPPNNFTNYLQFIHAFYGIGALIAPGIIYLIELNTLLILGSIAFLSGFSYFILQSP